MIIFFSQKMDIYVVGVKQFLSFFFYKENLIVIQEYYSNSYKNTFF